MQLNKTMCDKMVLEHYVYISSLDSWMSKENTIPLSDPQIYSTKPCCFGGRLDASKYSSAKPKMISSKKKVQLRDTRCMWCKTCELSHQINPVSTSPGPGVPSNCHFTIELALIHFSCVSLEGYPVIVNDSFSTRW